MIDLCVVTNSAAQLLFLVNESSVSKRIIHVAQQCVLVDFRFLFLFVCLFVCCLLSLSLHVSIVLSWTSPLRATHTEKLLTHKNKREGDTEGGRALLLCVQEGTSTLVLLLPLLPLLIMVPELVRRMVPRAKNAL